MADVQWKIRQNAEEHKAFAGSLGGWAREMTVKDNALRGASSASRSAPSIRNTAIDSSTTKVSTTIDARIRPTNYAAWDSFNADKEIERLEVGSEPMSTTATSANRTNEPDQQEIMNKQFADVEKETGNVYFKKGKYTKAVLHYTKAVDLNPSNPVYLTNKAMALIKLNRFAEAEQDCSSALALDTKNVKALWRRSTARKEQKHYLHAKEDLEKALVLEPSNTSFKEDLRILQELIEPSVQQSARKRRLPIREVGTPSDYRKGEAIVESKSMKIEELEFSSPPSQLKQSHAVSHKAEEIVAVKTRSLVINQEIAQSRPITTKNSILTSSTQQNYPIKTNKIEQLPSTQPQNSQNTTSISKTIDTQLISTPPATAMTTTLPAPPTASFEFERDMKALGDDMVIQHQYLKSIIPNCLPLIFPSIGTTPLSQILHIIHDRYLHHEEPKTIFNIMYNLSRCGRFSIALMLLDRVDGQAIREIMQTLARSFEPDDVAMTKIRRLCQLYSVSL